MSADLDYGWGRSWDGEARLRERYLDYALTRCWADLNDIRPTVDPETAREGVMVPTYPVTVPVTVPELPPTPAADTPVELDEDRYGDLNRQQLREECRRRGLSQQGTTSDMRDRLAARDRAEEDRAQ